MVAEKGYKQTDIGLLPEDWEIINIGKMGSFSKGSGIRKDEALSGEIPCIRYGEIYTRHNNYIKHFYSFISSEIAVTSKKLKKGDILFAGSGETKEEIGKCVAFIDNFEAYAGGDIVILSPTNADSLFLGYLLNAPFTQKQKVSRGQGDAVVHISATQLGNISIPVPPLSEQTAIATALSDMDALIAQTEKLIEKKKAIKQGVMQELLRPKEGWVTKKLGEVANCFAGGTPSTFNRGFWGGKIPWLPSGRVKNKIIKPIENEITITDLGLSSSAAKMIKPNSILIAITGATCGNIGLLTFSAAANQSVVAIEKNDNFDSVLIYYILLTMRDDILRLQTGSAQGGVNLKSVKSLEVIIPEKTEEQNEISQILWDFDKEIETYIEKLSKLKLQKQGMMQALLTGKIRLV